MPDKKRKFETKVHRKTLNPFFNESFSFKQVSALCATRFGAGSIPLSIKKKGKTDLYLLYVQKVLTQFIW